MRKTIAFNTDWKFYKKVEIYEKIDLPHTWNAVDGQDGGNDYYRGRCIYEKTFPMPEHTAEECVYLEILAAAYSAEVILNGKFLGTHEGGYSLFRFDLTNLLQSQNTIQIAVSNEANDHIYPQYADFTFYGGLYRGVNLVIVPKQHFTMLDDGSNGIFVTPKVAEDYQSAQVEVKAEINGNGKVHFNIGEQTVIAEIQNGTAAAVFHLNPVHLWNGIDDPYLYTLNAASDSGDQIAVHFGCRRYEIDPEKGSSSTLVGNRNDE